MEEKRFLKVFTLSLILCLGILLSLYLLPFEFLGYNQQLAIAQFYPPPVTGQISLTQATPLTISTLNSSYYQDLLTMHGTQASTFTNPFATYASTAMQHVDPFSQAAANTTSYSNIFGVNMQTGQGYYNDPFYSTGGRYINYSSRVGGFSSDTEYSMTPLGGTTHLGSSLTLPWTHIHTNINTAAGIAGAGTSIEHAAVGMPTVYNMVGMNPSVAGTLALMTYGSQTAEMDRMLSNTYAYTKEGMAYIPVASYYNPASVGGTNYFFAGDISHQEAGTVGTGPLAASYSMVQEVPESLVGVVGASLGTAAALSGTAFAGWVGSAGATASPYSGWTGTAAATTGAATTGAATAGVPVSAFAGFGAAPGGPAFAGWGVPSGASFGMVSAGPAGGFGGPVGGGMIGAGPVGGGMAGGPTGGGFMSGAGVSYGGVGALGW